VRMTERTVVSLTERAVERTIDQVAVSLTKRAVPRMTERAVASLPGVLPNHARRDVGAASREATWAPDQGLQDQMVLLYPRSPLSSPLQKHRLIHQRAIPTIIAQDPVVLPPEPSSALLLPDRVPSGSLLSFAWNWNAWNRTRRNRRGRRGVLANQSGLLLHALVVCRMVQEDRVLRAVRFLG
jgi:hypothetical protein